MDSAAQPSRQSAAPAAGLSSRNVSPRDLTPAERVQWKNLCDNDPALASPFYSSQFLDALQASGVRVHVCILERDGQCVGFFPFQFSHGITRSLGAAERAGSDLSDYCGLVAIPNLQISDQELLTLSRLTSFTFSHLDETQSRHGLTGKQSEVGYVARLDGGGSGYWSEIGRRDKSLTADTARRLRRLSDTLGPLRFEFRAQDPHKALDELIVAKRAQYARTGKRDVLESPWKAKLLHNIVEYSEPEFSGIISTLYAGSAWLASHFGILGRSVLHYWFPVYNHEMERFSPGRLLYKSIVDVADEHGITAIDRGAGDAPAKRALSNESHIYFSGRWQRPGIRTLAYTAAMSLKWRLEALNNF